MSTLLEYINSVKTQHKYRIKLACGCDDAIMDKIEKHLEKYDAEEISNPQKLILQRRPLDFPNLDMAEVHIVDFTANLPVSQDMLRAELSKILRVPEGMIVVRNALEPREQEAEHDEEAEKFMKDPKKLEAKLGTDYSKDEGSEVTAEETFGNKYNTNLLKELKKLADDRKKKLETPKVTDPDIPASEPEIGDSPRTNTKSTVRAFTSPTGKGK